MASEIRVLDGTGGQNYRVLFLFPIAVPKQFGGSAVVPTPSTALDPIALQAAQVPTDVRASLDNGTMAYRIVSFSKDVAATNPQLAARLQAIYTQQLAAVTAAYTARYLHLGTVLNAP